MTSPEWPPVSDAEVEAARERLADWVDEYDMPSRVAIRAALTAARSALPEAGTVEVESDDRAAWLDSVLDDLATEAETATTPQQAFHIAIRAAHAVRRLNFVVESGYNGAWKSRFAIERVSGVRLGDYPEHTTPPTPPSEAGDVERLQAEVDRLSSLVRAIEDSRLDPARAIVKADRLAGEAIIRAHNAEAAVAAERERVLAVIDALTQQAAKDETNASTSNHRKRASNIHWAYRKVKAQIARTPTATEGG